jgi:uncharacterized protein YjbI with pentapeptide repeats
MSKLEIWQRLIQGRSLEGLDVPSSDGRIDLTGLRLPEPAVVSRGRNSVAEVVEIEPNGNVRGARWRNIDFSGSTLNSLRFHDCEIDNCRFENCQLSDLRMWSTKITRSSFQRSDLQGAALGGVSNDGQRNQFLEVDFSHADLSRTVYKAAAFAGCLFRDTRLDKVDFQTSTFCRCRFEGELNYVLFYRRGFKGDAFPPNEMNDIDMRGAKLRYVEFRGLALDHVQLPQGHDHLVVGNYLAAVDKLLAVFELQGDLPSRKLAAYFSIMKKWTPRESTQGVISLLDVADMAGAEGVRQVREFLGQ